MAERHIMTYDQYDVITENCELLKTEAENQTRRDGIAEFDIYKMWPRTEELAKLDLSNGIQPYLEFLIFWSEVELDEDVLPEEQIIEYRKARKYINKLLRDHIELQ